jgi:peptidoglycan hydrolase-like protein with peptidoglycan-binding domain
MQGDVVGQLQLMLQKLGRKVTADGKFGAETEAALASLNLPTTLSAEAFQAIRAKTAKPVVPPNETPYQKLVRLGYNAGTEIEPAIAIRKELTSTVTTDTIVKRLLTGTTKTLTNIQRAYNTLYKTSLVKDLSNLSMSRIRFNEQITRLQALSGLGNIGGKKVIAKVNTLVRSESGAMVTVPANKIVGTLTIISNNMVWFRDAQGQLMRVPVSDVRIS